VARKILLLITDLEIGGTPTVVRELALRLRSDRAFEVAVACLGSWGPVADQLRNAEIEVTALHAAGQWDVGVVGRLVRLIRRGGFHTVFSFLVHANAAAAVASPVCRDVRFVQSIQTSQRYPRWHWNVQHIAAAAARQIVVPSESVKETAMHLAGIDAGKLQIISNAVEPGEWQDLGSGQGGKRVGFIGRLDPIKRIEDLILAMQHLDLEFHLDIFGEGRHRHALERLIATRGLAGRVALRGSVARPQEAMRQIDVLVLPSLAEGFGLVLIEAMAAGIPVIGTQAPGIAEVIGDGRSGVLVPVKDPPAIAAVVRRICGDDGYREALIAGGKERVQSAFTWQAVYPAYRELLLG
jgi:glycosyltransferase involved in cell wall biosynthesis